MKTGKGTAALIVLALAGVTACQPSTDSKNVDAASDEVAVRQVAEELYGHLEAGNWTAAAQLYRDDALVIAPGAPPMDKSTLFAMLAQPAPALPPGTSKKWTVESEEIVVSGDLAYERGRYTERVVDDATGATVADVPKTPEMIFAHIFRRDADGTWKAWRYHPAPNVAPPAAGAGT